MNTGVQPGHLGARGVSPYSGTRPNFLNNNI